MRIKQGEVLVARCEQCGVTVRPWGGFVGSVGAVDPEFRKQTRCPRCHSFPAEWTWESAKEPDVLVFIEDYSGKRGRLCDVCGSRNPNQVSLYTATRQVFSVCHDGHFEGDAVDAWIGVVTHMTGPKMLDAFLWFPEGFVPRLREAEYQRIMAEVRA